jgi:hypothetical protein
MDSVDDLEAAEDLIAELYVLAGETVAPRVIARLVDGWETYCRPTCDTHGAPHDDDDDTCGCPCHDRAEATG